MQFPTATFAFLSGIEANNSKTWFDANRTLYETGYVAPGQEFVEALGPLLRELSPEVQFAPKVNGSLSRINRDIRFSKDKRPYKNHLDLWFWHGDRKAWDAPGFYLRLTAEDVFLGTGMYRFDKATLDTYRNAVVLARSGKALVDAVAAVKSAGPYEIGHKTRKLMPKGFAAPADRAEFLLHEGLTAGITLPAAVAMEPGFETICLEHFRATWPITRWLLTEL